MRRLLLTITLLWAQITRNHLLTIVTLKEIIMADTSALDANVARLNAGLDRLDSKIQADAAALAAATADTQPVIDAAATAVGVAADRVDAMAPVPSE